MVLCPREHEVRLAAELGPFNVRGGEPDPEGGNDGGCIARAWSSFVRAAPEICFVV